MPKSNHLLIVVITTIGLLMISISAKVYAQTAISLTGYPYNCNPLYNNGNFHCYGETEWNKAKFTYTGVQANDSVQSINGGGAHGYSNGFMTNEVWLNDFISYFPDSYWVEAGYIQGENVVQHAINCTYDEQFFWADNRPNGGGFHAHCYTMHSGDYGHDVIDNIREDPNNLESWDIQITPFSSSPIYGISTNNAIAPNDIQIGEELFGDCSSGCKANGPTTIFHNNEFRDSVSNWHYFNDNSWTITGYNPPWAGWKNGEDPSHSSTGGVLYACTLPGNTNPC